MSGIQGKNDPGDVLASLVRDPSMSPPPGVMEAVGEAYLQALREEREAEQAMIRREAAIQTALAREAWKRRMGDEPIEPVLARLAKSCGGPPSVPRTPTAPEPLCQSGTLASTRSKVVTIRSYGSQMDEKLDAIHRRLEELTRSNPQQKKARTRRTAEDRKREADTGTRTFADRTLRKLAHERRESLKRDGYPERLADERISAELQSLSAEKLLPLLQERGYTGSAKTVGRTHVYKGWKPHRRKLMPDRRRLPGDDGSLLSEGLGLRNCPDQHLRNSVDGSDRDGDEWAREQGVTLPRAF